MLRRSFAFVQRLYDPSRDPRPHEPVIVFERAPVFNSAAVIVREYTSSTAYAEDVQRMVARGYEVVSVATEPQSVGAFTILTLGLYALLSKRKQHYIVTYRLRGVLD